MTRGGKIASDIFGTLGGVVLAFLGVGLIVFWIVGTWMNSTSYLAAGIACIAAGHQNLSTTMGYSRGSGAAIARVLLKKKEDDNG